MSRDRQTTDSNKGENLASSAIVEAQRAMAEQSTRLATAACDFAVSVNKAWMEVWHNHLDEYVELPKRFTKAQNQFVEQAFDQYQESMEHVGDLTAQAGSEALEGLRRAGAAGERFSSQMRSEARDMTKAGRPKDVSGQMPGESHLAGPH